MPEQINPEVKQPKNGPDYILYWNITYNSKRKYSQNITFHKEKQALLWYWMQKGCKDTSRSSKNIF